MRVQWTIVVTAEAGDVEGAAMQLKGLLKVAGRRFGMRCVAVGEERLARAAVCRERRTQEERGKERGGRGGRAAGLFG